MRKDNDQSQLSRREFVKGSLAAGVSVAITAAVPASAVAASDTVMQGAVEQAKKQQGYHLSNHILDYYKAAAL